jgi:hypothetical protein
MRLLLALGAALALPGCLFDDDDDGDDDDTVIIDDDDGGDEGDGSDGGTDGNDDGGGDDGSGGADGIDGESDGGGANALEVEGTGFRDQLQGTSIIDGDGETPEGPLDDDDPNTSPWDHWSQ